MSMKGTAWNALRDLGFGGTGQRVVAVRAAASSRISLEPDAELFAQTNKLASNGTIPWINGGKLSSLSPG